ncbi:helix-turn-helix domain-containing protein [Candidatus Liberibacter solanacearum]|uniref:Helix-turn-helix domain-containing protein n=1 Tax=Candidatus Liberibacter solanacearum TaxID=556287 RepID=A0A424FKT3_9HYPH|nr:helix-turn-helix domain-containing protein [Candidatus Liberibacter solanacearum]RPD36773.1 helix-turn-helix domain-containing protein [Candidatus Liberibacter solanacearum]
MEKEVKNTLNWKEIGQRFRDLRESRGLDQIGVVKKAQAFNNAICQYEAGTAPASTNYALFLRNEFGASFDWLYDGDVIDREYKDVQQKKILDPHAIGARLKEIRVEKGMTQVEFGRLIGLSSVGIGNIENGHRTPEIKTALKIKRALNKPLDWIYFGDKCIGTSNRVQSPTTTKPYIPLKQLKRELKEEIISHFKHMDESELALLATRLRMEQKHNTTLSDSETQDRLRANQIKSNQSSQESKKKSRL